MLGIMKSRLTKVVFASAFALSGTAFLVAETATPAGASAYSCTGYGIGIPKIGVTSQFCGQTVASGTYIQTLGAGYSAPIAWAGWLTNTRVSVQLINNRGQVYWSATSGQQNGGSAVGAWKWNFYGSAQAGTVRYTLLSNGATIAVVQQSIH